MSVINPDLATPLTEEQAKYAQKFLPTLSRSRVVERVAALEASAGASEALDAVIEDVTALDSAVMALTSDVGALEAEVADPELRTMLVETLMARGTLTFFGDPELGAVFSITNSDLGVTDTYEILDAGDTVAADTNIGVLRGASAADTRQNIIAAINGAVASPTGILKSDASAAERNGTLRLTAREAGVTVSVTHAFVQGGASTGILNPTMVTATGAGNASWMANIAADGEAWPVRQVVVLRIPVTAGLIAGGSKWFYFPAGVFPPRVRVTAYTSLGAVKTGFTDTFVVTSFGGSGVLDCTFVGGVGDLADGDEVLVELFA